MNLEENEEPLVDQPRPSQKLSKWAIKTLESVHLDEVGNMGTRISTRHEAGGDADNSGDVEDMEFLFNHESSLSANFEPTSFEEDSTRAKWKEAMQNEYDKSDEC